jgi:hypothetical protein
MLVSGRGLLHEASASINSECYPRKRRFFVFAVNSNRSNSQKRVKEFVV